MIRSERVTASLEGDFVVFLIGMRINSGWKVHRWMPVMRSMQRMLIELAQRPELGLLNSEMWLGRTTVMVQYWRSMDQLIGYAKSKDAEHLPAWKAFNRSVGTDGSVGIWHETYAASPGTHESLYTNMPPFGLGKAGALVSASGHRMSASERLRGRSPAAGEPGGELHRAHCPVSRPAQEETQAHLQTLSLSGSRGPSR